MDLYAQRFRKGSYQPRAEQQRIAEVVREVEESAGRGYSQAPRQTGARSPGHPPPEAPAVRVRSSNEQLRLL